MVYEYGVWLSASVLVVCYCFKCGVLCTVCVCVRISAVSNTCVEGSTMHVLFCADTLLNGVYAAAWSLHGYSCAIHERIVDL